MIMFIVSIIYHNLTVKYGNYLDLSGCIHTMIASTLKIMFFQELIYIFMYYKLSYGVLSDDPYKQVKHDIKSTVVFSSTYYSIYFADQRDLLRRYI